MQLVLQVNVRSGQKSVDARARRFLESRPSAIDVFLVGTGERGNDGTLNLRRHRLYRLKIALGSDRKSRLQDVHTQAVELVGHFDFFLHTHAAARRLLPVA